MQMARGKKQEPGVSPNQSVARALEILEALSRAGRSLGVRDVARSVGLPSSIVQRLLATLANCGFAEQDSGRKYGIGPRAFAVGNAFIGSNVLAREALNELQRLADDHQLNGYLGVLRNSTVVYLLACQSSGPIAIKVRAGSETHLHSTALGKALLADRPEEQARRLLGKEPFARLTSHTKTRFSALLPDLQQARRAGYAVSDEENLIGVYAVGAVIRDWSGQVVAALSVALPRHEMTRARLPQIAAWANEAAARISRRLGAPLARRAA
jgi:DNA-binding IclR family transcriptional regulator